MKAHSQITILKQHSLLSLDQAKELSLKKGVKCDPKKCKVHEEEALKLYCSTCEIVICRDCIIIDHKNHDYAFIRQVAEYHRNRLQEYASSVKERFALADACEKTNTMMTKIETRKEQVKRDIEAKFDDLIEQLNQRKQILYTEVDVLATRKLKALGHQINDLHTIASTFKFVEEVVEKWDDMEMMNILKQVKQKLSDLNSSCIDSEPVEGYGLNFQTSPMEETYLAKFGDINGHSFDINKCQVKISPKSWCRPGESVCFDVVSKSSDGWVSGSQFDKVEAYIGRHNRKEIPCNKEQVKPGVFRMSCQVKNNGKYSVFVYVNGELLTCCHKLPLVIVQDPLWQ